MHVYGDDLKYLAVATPPLDEQVAIGRYLAVLNERVNRFTRVKRRLVELLNEQRIELIQERVLRGRGVDAQVDVGIPWLGSIPLSWEVKRAKWFFRESDARSVSGTEELLSVSHITGVTRRSEKNVTMFKAESYVGHKVCEPSDLVVNTMWAWMGALGTASERGIVSPAYAVYHPLRDDQFDPQFIDYLLRTPTYVAEYTRRSTGIRSSRLRLYPPQFLDIPLIRPPLEEQREIVTDVRRATSELEGAMRVALRQIELVNEYRIRMMFDVLSGKRDVREAAKGLPDVSSYAQDQVSDADAEEFESEELDPSDEGPE